MLLLVCEWEGSKKQKPECKEGIACANIANIIEIGCSVKIIELVKVCLRETDAVAAIMCPLYSLLHICNLHTHTSGETLCCDNRQLIGTPLIVFARQSQKNRD